MSKKEPALNLKRLGKDFEKLMTHIQNVGGVLNVSLSILGNRAMIQIGEIHFEFELDRYPFGAPSYLRLGEKLLKEVVYDDARQQGFDNIVEEALMMAVDFPEGQWSPEITLVNIYQKVKDAQDALGKNWGL